MVVNLPPQAPDANDPITIKPTYQMPPGKEYMRPVLILHEDEHGNASEVLAVAFREPEGWRYYELCRGREIRFS